MSLLLTAPGANAALKSDVQGDVHTVHHRDADRAELLTALAQLDPEPGLAAVVTALVGKASDAGLAAIVMALQGTLAVSATALPLPSGAATQSTLASILAKLIAAPATEAKQDVLVGHVDGIEGLLTSLLAKVIAAPATEAKQDSLLAALALLAPASGAIAVTPSDSTTLANVRALKIGGAGSVVATIGGSDFTFTCSAGELLNVRATKVKAASTATGIVALT